MEVEFLDAAPGDGPDEVLDARGSRFRILVVVAVLAALVGAVLVARAAGGPSPAAAPAPTRAPTPAPPPASGPATVDSVDALPGATLGEAGQVTLPAGAAPYCHRACTVALFVPGAVLDALYRVYPKARITSQFSVYSPGNGALLDRAITARLGSGRLQVSVVPRHGGGAEAGGGVQRGHLLRAEADFPGYRVTLTVTGGGTSLPELVRLAADPRLIVTG